MNKFIIICILGLTLIGVVFFLINPHNSVEPSDFSSEESFFEQPRCGNQFCESDERCDSCPQDCRCKEGEYCLAGVGICRKEVCGNGVCVSGEEVDCCQDCGCPANHNCIPALGTCKQVVLKNETVEKALADYTKTLGVEAVILQMKDSYYGDSYAKEVILNCTNKDCKLLAYIDENGNVLSLTRLG